MNATNSCFTQCSIKLPVINSWDYFIQMTESIKEYSFSALWTQQTGLVSA